MGRLLALLFALAASTAGAQSGDLIEFPPEARADRDGLFVAVLTTADVEAFAQEWIDGGDRLQSTVTQRAVRGRELQTLVLFQDCRAGPDGKCNLTGRFTYLTPDGSVYGTVDQDVWTEAPNRGGVMVAIGPSLIVDPPDPMGQWTLRADIRDHMRGVSLTVQTPIEVDTAPATPN